MISPDLVEFNEARARHRELLALLAEREWWLKNHDDLAVYLKSQAYKAREREIAKHYWYEGAKYLTRGLEKRKYPSRSKEVTGTVKTMGTGCHIYVPKDWFGKKVRVTLIE